MRGLLLAYIVVFSLWTVARAEPACLPQQDIATHGVRLGDNEARACRLLGKPKKLTKSTAEDDGGEYPVRILAYQSLDVTLGRSQVESIVIRGWHHPIAAGLFIGGSPNLLQSKALIDNDELATGATFGIRCCGAAELPVAGLSIFVVHKRVAKA